MNSKVIVGGIIVILIIIGAIYYLSKTPTAASPTQRAQTAEQTAATSTPRVQGQDVSVGTGAAAAPGDQVSVLYVGYVGSISTTTIFDSSAAHGNKPFTFTLGTQGLIPGFQIGVNGMKVGGERLMQIPPELGYGNQPVHQKPSDPSSPVVIPANSTLIFDVKLVGVKAGSTTTGQAPQQTTPRQ